jgi:protease I
VGLHNKRVVILVADMSHDDEIQDPRKALEQEGANVVLAGMQKEMVSSKGEVLVADLTTDRLRAEDFDAVVVPGGFGAADRAGLRFLKEMDRQKKLIAAICHGARALGYADVVRGKKVTCIRGLEGDPAEHLEKAGGIFIREPLVCDQNLITAQRPEEMPGFISAVIAFLNRSS